MDFSVDKENNRISVKREFAAPLASVWAAWTQSDILDQWWAPKPWKSRTKTMDFREGGHWLYAMVGPEGEEHWARADYLTISPQKNYTAKDSFCDANGVQNNDAPSMDWDVSFSNANDNTMVTINIKLAKQEDLETILKMGFKEGFTAGLQNLDELFAGK